MAGGEIEEERGGSLGPFFSIGIRPGRGSETTAEHFRIDDAGVERNGGHARWKFLGECLGEPFNGEFGRAIGSDFRRSGASPTGAEVYDYPSAPVDHGRQEMAEDVEDAIDVDVDDIGELRRAQLPKRGGAVNERGIIEEEIGRAKFLDYLAGPSPHLFIIADIDRVPEVG